MSHSSRGSVVNKLLQCERRSSCQFQMTSRPRTWQLTSGLGWHVLFSFKRCWRCPFTQHYTADADAAGALTCRCAWKISCLWRASCGKTFGQTSRAGWLTRRRTNDALSLRSSSVMQGAYDFTSHIVLIWNLDPIETSKMCHRLRSGSRLACTQWVSKTRCRWWVVFTNPCRVEVFQGLWLPSPIRCRCCEGKNEGASWNLTCAHGDGSHSTWRKRFLWERERETHISW